MSQVPWSRRLLERRPTPAESWDRVLESVGWGPSCPGPGAVPGCSHTQATGTQCAGPKPSTGFCRVPGVLFDLISMFSVCREHFGSGFLCD